MKPSVHAILAAIGAAVALSGALPEPAHANERQRCLNDCTQAGATQQKSCQADHDQKMIACSKLGSNPERNACKRQAAQDLRTCSEAARQQVKQCQQACPPKK